MTAVDGGSTASYTYDALNRRVRVANSTNTMDYQFDAAGRRTVEWQESTNFGIPGNVYWGSTPIALHGDNGTEYFEQQDWLGTERVRTDYTGAVVGSYVSLAFGDGFSATGTDEDPYHFAGTDRDSESATDHAQFRQFREATGRWMSPDPYKAKSEKTGFWTFTGGDPAQVMLRSCGLSGCCKGWRGSAHDRLRHRHLVRQEQMNTASGLSLRGGLAASVASILPRGYRIP